MFHKNLKSVLEEKDISQVELARMTNLTKSGISQYVSGKIIPSQKHIEVIADALEVPLSRLVVTKDEDEEKNVPMSVAAKRLGWSQDVLRLALKQGSTPFGFAVEIEPGKWKFHISPKQLEAYLG